MIHWLEKSNHIIDGIPWIFNSYVNWQKQPPFFCESTIRRLIKKLGDMEIILSCNFDAVINFFSSNIHMPTPHECEKLKLLYKDIKSPNLIIKAMKFAVENRVRSFRYMESILYNWMDLDLHTLSEVQEYMKNFKETEEKQMTYLENKVSTSEVAKERKDDNHGEKKCSGARQYSKHNKKAQGEVQGKYAGFKPEEPELPEFTEEDFNEFL